jgi:hypothetical protein
VRTIAWFVHPSIVWLGCGIGHCNHVVRQCSSTFAFLVTLA